MELERLVGSNPALALARIAEADRREGKATEARAALQIQALVALQRMGQAHAKLQQFYERYQDSSQLPALERRTGYHPRPMSRLHRR